MRIVRPQVETEIRRIDLARRPASLNGKVVAFFDAYCSRTKDGAAAMYPLMAALRRLLERRYDLAGTIWRPKASIARASRAEVIVEVSAAADVVVNGECASGSSVYASVHDAVELERSGIPTITICHHQLEVTARAHARTLGIPELPLLVEQAALTSIVARSSTAFATQQLTIVEAALTTGERHGL